MSEMKKAYYYLFYKLYKFWDYISIPKFWSDFKAIVSIIALEIWSFFSIINFYSLFNKIKLDLKFTNPFIFLPFLIIIVFNYIAFIHYDNIWKKYNEEFDKLPKNKNFIGGIIVWTVIISIIAIHFFII